MICRCALNQINRLCGKDRRSSMAVLTNVVVVFMFIVSFLFACNFTNAVGDIPLISYQSEAGLENQGLIKSCMDDCVKLSRVKIMGCIISPSTNCIADVSIDFLICSAYCPENQIVSVPDHHTDNTAT